MGNFFLFFLLDEADKEIGSSLCGPISSAPHIPSKLDNWLSRHKAVDALFPYVTGIGLGLLPFVISMLIWKAAGI